MEVDIFRIISTCNCWIDILAPLQSHNPEGALGFIKSFFPLRLVIVGFKSQYKFEYG